MADAPAPDSPACENCARFETNPANLVRVHRVYLEFDEWGEEEPKATVVEEIESWCASCRSIYPHEVAANDA